MNRLRNRLILVFVAATLAPVLVTAWISVTLLDQSLSLASRELDQVSKSLEKTGRELYQRAGEKLKQDAALGRIKPERYPAAARDEFFSNGETETLALGGNNGDRLDYLVQHGDEVWVYSTSLHGVAMQQLFDEYAHARTLVGRGGTGDLGGGLIYTVLLLAAAMWVVAFLALIYFAHRISHPIQRLTTGLSEVAAGHLDYRVPVTRDDEIGAAIRRFNSMADELKQSQERLIYVTRLESWQALARKMAHEVKNSLTPIRLTMEEIASRQSGPGGEFYQQASQIVVDEVLSLERRVAARFGLRPYPPISPSKNETPTLLAGTRGPPPGAPPEVGYPTAPAAARPTA